MNRRDAGVSFGLDHNNLDRGLPGPWRCDRAMANVEANPRLVTSEVASQRRSRPMVPVGLAGEGRNVTHVADSLTVHHGHRAYCWASEPAVEQ